MELLMSTILTALRFYYYILVASVLLSWIPDLKRSTIGQWIDRIADPYMRLFRGFIVIGVMDFTPMLGFFFYYFGLNAFESFVSTLG